jgi:hypothetical protein
MLQNLRNHLRFSWLVFRRDLKATFTVCQRCKALGAYPCSICGLVPLCERCAREESIKLDKHKTTRAYVRAGGFGSYSETI